MAVRRLHPDQPADFAFTPENLSWAKAQLTKFPEGREASAVIPLLWRAQEQHDGWLPEPAMRYIADMLGMPYIRVLEVATFYTMFQLGPVGKKAHIQVCGTTPCMLRGSEDLIKVCKSRIAAHPHEVSADGDFSWEEVECLGACVNAPMVQIWKDTYEDLTPESFEKMLDAISAGKEVVPGPQMDRIFGAPEGGVSSLTDIDDDTKGGMPLAHVVAGSEAASRVFPGVAINGGPQPEAASASALKAKPAAKAKAAPKKAAEPKKVEAKKAEVKKPAAKPAAKVEQKALPAKAEQPLLEGNKPALLEAPRGGKADDFKRIKGVGAKIEKTLHELGVYHFDQIAAWDEANKAWVDDNLKFRGRIDREGWIEQAKVLAEGGETEFSKRVDSGSVPSSKA